MADMAGYSGIQRDIADMGDTAGYSGMQRDTADTAGYYKNVLQSTGGSRSRHNQARFETSSSLSSNGVRSSSLRALPPPPRPKRSTQLAHRASACREASHPISFSSLAQWRSEVRVQDPTLAHGHSRENDSARGSRLPDKRDTKVAHARTSRPVNIGITCGCCCPMCEPAFRR